MIQLTSHVEIFLYVPPVDFRMGMNGLINFCEAHIINDPFNGSLFIFKSRRGTSLKMLMYDGQGWWLIQKRLSEGIFSCWPQNADEKVTINMYEFQVLIGNGDPSSCNSGLPWRNIRKK